MKTYVIQSMLTNLYYYNSYSEKRRWVHDVKRAQRYTRRNHAKLAMKGSAFVCGGHYRIVEYEIVPTGHVEEVTVPHLRADVP